MLAIEQRCCLCFSKSNPFGRVDSAWIELSNWSGNHSIHETINIDLSWSFKLLVNYRIISWMFVFKFDSSQNFASLWYNHFAKSRLLLSLPHSLNLITTHSPTHTSDHFCFRLLQCEKLEWHSHLSKLTVLDLTEVSNLTSSVMNELTSFRNLQELNLSHVFSLDRSHLTSLSPYINIIIEDQRYEATKTRK